MDTAFRTVAKDGPNLPAPGAGVYRTYLEYGVSKTSVSNKNWRGNIKDGKSATTVRTIVDTKLVRWDPVKIITARRYTGGGIMRIESSDFSALYDRMSNVPTPSAGTSSKRAANLFLQKVYESNQKFEGFSVFAELRQTVRSLRNPMSALRSLLNAHKRIVRGTGARNGPGLKKLVACAWLELQYGVKPLIHDIFSGLETLDRIMYENINNMTQRIKVSVVDPAVSTVDGLADNTSGTAGYSAWQANLSYRTDTIVSTHIVGAVRLRVLSKREHWGFDSSSLVQGIWEGIPYSFLVDHMLPIQGWLQALGVAKSDLAWTSTSVVRKTTRSVSTVNHRHMVTLGVPTELVVLSPGRGVVQRKRIDRTDVIPSASFPSIRFKASWSALVNDVALLIAVRK
jgi:hypothetical protein